MKYNVILVIVFVMYCGIAGFTCKKPSSHNVKVMDGYYNIIKIIISDPEVQERIGPDQFESIHQIDKAYKRARDNGWTDEKMYIKCGIDICDILSRIDMDQDRKNEITAVRMGLNLLLSRYP